VPVLLPVELSRLRASEASPRPPDFTKKSVRSDL
jgi:hypothetical protein